MYIKIDNLSKRFDDNVLFSKINLMITDSHRVGLVGKNGSGKTTFLKLLAGLVKPEKGSIIIDPPKSSILYHQQVLDIESEDTTSDSFTCFTYLLSQKKDLFALWLSINESTDAEVITQAIETYTEKGGYIFEDKIIKACRELKLQSNQKLSELSGGQKTRLQFGKLLIEDHSILLLDEPTNHLDIDGIEWFYSFIEQYKGIVVIATHDRNLLTRSINKILDFEYQTITEYTGNYEFYKTKKRALRVAAENRVRQNEKKVDGLNEAAKKLDERIHRHEVRANELKRTVERVARLTKKNKSAKTRIIKQKLTLYRDNDKLTRNYKLDRQAVKLKSNRGNLLEKARRINTSRSREGWSMKIDFKTPQIQSDFVLKVDSISVAYDGLSVLQDFSLEILKNQKIAVTGPNGSGKTTLLKCIAGLKEYTGSIKVSESVKVGYLEQETSSLNPEKSVLEDFLSVASKNITETEARSFLHFFLFESDQPLRPIGTLSEGEKLKLKLAKLLYSEVNLLLLDEPTNHLDIASQEVIEKALHDFTGSILLVSHDEALIDGMGIQKQIVLE